MYVAFINSCIGGYGSWTPLCTGKGFFLFFLAWSRPSSLNSHFLGIKDWVMRISSSRAAKWPPYEIILSDSIFPHIRYIRKYGIYTVIYAVCTAYGNPMYGSGQPFCLCDELAWSGRATHTKIKRLSSIEQHQLISLEAVTRAGVHVPSMLFAYPSVSNLS